MRGIQIVWGGRSSGFWVVNPVFLRELLFSSLAVLLLLYYKSL